MFSLKKVTVTKRKRFTYIKIKFLYGMSQKFDLYVFYDNLYLVGIRSVCVSNNCKIIQRKSENIYVYIYNVVTFV